MNRSIMGIVQPKRTKETDWWLWRNCVVWECNVSEYVLVCDWLQLCMNRIYVNMKLQHLRDKT